jgi:hypothetical protein
VIDQDTPHQIGGNGKEVSPVLPVYIPRINEPQKGLVDQGRRLQGMTAALPAQIAGRLSAQFFVDEWRELIQSPFVAITPLFK